MVFLVQNIFQHAIIEDLVFNLKKDGNTWKPYSLKPKIENGKTVAFILSKEYEDYKTHEEKTQSGELSFFDILSLRKLIKELDRQAFLLTMYSVEKSNNGMPNNDEVCYGQSDGFGGNDNGSGYNGNSYGNNSNGYNGNSYGNNSNTTNNNNDDGNRFISNVIDDDIPF
jgi:hypothetical protein